MTSRPNSDIFDSIDLKLSSLRRTSGGTHQKSPNSKIRQSLFLLTHHFGRQQLLCFRRQLFRNLEGFEQDDGICVETTSSTPRNTSDWSLCCIYFIDTHNIGKAWPGIFFTESPSKFLLCTAFKVYNKAFLYSK